MENWNILSALRKNSEREKLKQFWVVCLFLCTLDHRTKKTKTGSQLGHENASPWMFKVIWRRAGREVGAALPGLGDRGPRVTSGSHERRA